MSSSQSAKEAFRLLGIEWVSEKDLDKVDDSFVKRQYRRLALKLHPDKNKSDPNAELRFNQLKQAHDEMMNEETRRIYIQTLRALLQRKEEQSGRNAEKLKFAEDLERRETEYNKQSGSKGFDGDLSAIRARHRALIEELHAKRNVVQPSSRPPWSTVLGGPDDSNMSLDYWINYGLSETPLVRQEKTDRFAAFIFQKLRT